jgi:uncharacterized membrane protein
MVFDMTATRFARFLTLFGCFGLVALLCAWYGWLAPSTHFGVGFALVALLLPLAFPLPGLLRGRAYTHAWTAFISLLYFTHGVIEAWASPIVLQRRLAAAEIALSMALFVGTTLYARLRGRELKAQQSS